MPVTLKICERARTPRDLFGNPFFDGSFFDDVFGNSVEKQVTLTSATDTVSVQPLPTANRPVDFSGAMGQFTVTAEAAPDHVTVGEA